MAPFPTLSVVPRPLLSEEGLFSENTLPALATLAEGSACSLAVTRIPLLVKILLLPFTFHLPPKIETGHLGEAPEVWGGGLPRQQLTADVTMHPTPRIAPAHTHSCSHLDHTLSTHIPIRTRGYILGDLPALMSMLEPALTQALQGEGQLPFFLSQEARAKWRRGSDWLLGSENQTHFLKPP